MSNTENKSNCDIGTTVKTGPGPAVAVVYLDHEFMLVFEDENMVIPANYPILINKDCNIVAATLNPTFVNSIPKFIDWKSVISFVQDMKK
jgi:hypothetical protein